MHGSGENGTPKPDKCAIDGIKKASLGVGCYPLDFSTELARPFVCDVLVLGQSFQNLQR
jgi:hypothetical protein